LAEGPVAPDGVIYHQEVRSLKAVQLTEPHAVRFLRQGESKEVEFTLPAGTLFVVARDKTGEMYCTAVASDTNILAAVLLQSFVAAFHDAGVCLRDSDFDGTFDSEVVFDQAPNRTRTPYEILGVENGTWKPIHLKAEPLEQAKIPAADLRLTYDYRSGGLFNKPFGLLHFALCWPKELVTSDGGSGDGKACANFNFDPYGAGSRVNLGEGVHSSFTSYPFSLDVVSDKTKRLVVTMKDMLPEGYGVLRMAGRVTRSDRSQLQYTVVRITPTKRPPGEAPPI
jgi:hypothetical protein